jgi:S-adenosylmethionine decarboxylase
MQYDTFGRHIIADAWGIDFNKINDLEFLKFHMKEAANVSGATVLSVEGQAFSPVGATVMVVLSESHLSIHTYPERGFAAIDGYTCGNQIDPKVAINYLVKILQPKNVYMKKIVRGTGELIISSG